MNARPLIASLERFRRIFPALIDGVPDDEMRWKPPDGAWSILEIICHLADEEVEDFRTRLRMTLDDPSQDWPSINPEAWAGERRYNEQNPANVVKRFISERDASIGWLKELRDPDWSRTKRHPKFPSISAGDLLASWAAHDALHLRQIAKRLYQLTQHFAGAYQAGYAGEWGA